MILLKIQNKSTQPLPKYQTDLAAGMDLHFDGEDFTLAPLERTAAATGLFVEIPAGYEGQVRPRSGLAAKQGVTVLNAPGTIDADYRGEIRVLLVNLPNAPVTIKRGERIAQLVIAAVEHASIEQVFSLSDTTRGQQGFGSTGK